MKYLLDTHAFLWALASSNKIPIKTKEEIINPDNTVYLSSVSLWEIAIKTRIKKLDLGGIGVDELIPLAEKMGMELIALSPEEAVQYGKLEEDSHFDPFDRLLIWQAIQRKMTIISGDREFRKFTKHGLKLLWK